MQITRLLANVLVQTLTLCGYGLEQRKVRAVGLFLASIIQATKCRLFLGLQSELSGRLAMVYFNIYTLATHWS